jgi:hypothetical protein
MARKFDSNPSFLDTLQKPRWSRDPYIEENLTVKEIACVRAVCNSYRLHGDLRKHLDNELICTKLPLQPNL